MESLYLWLCHSDDLLYGISGIKITNKEFWWCNLFGSREITCRLKAPALTAHSNLKAASRNKCFCRLQQWIATELHLPTATPREKRPVEKSSLTPRLSCLSMFCVYWLQEADTLQLYVFLGKNSATDKSQEVWAELNRALQSVFCICCDLLNQETRRWKEGILFLHLASSFAKLLFYFTKQCRVFWLTAQFCFYVRYQMANMR